MEQAHAGSNTRMTEALARVAPVLALICTSVFAYGLSGPHIGWMSDDYERVFGASSAVPDWRSAFAISGDGHVSPWRLLKYPLQGYLSLWLGPASTHVLQFTGHVVCVVLFYRLLKRLAWPTPAALAAGMLFSASPWLAQAVYWWPAAAANWATILVLAAAHGYIRWAERHQRRWLMAYAGFVLLSLATYELWLGGFLFFAGLDWYCRRVKAHPLRTAWTWRYGAIAAPFLIYAALFAMAPADRADRLFVNVRNLPYAFALVQLWVFHWPLDVHWRWTWQAAEQAFRSAPGVAVLIGEAAVFVLLSVGWVRTVLRRPDSRTDVPQARVPVWESLILGWSLLLGSRIVLMLQDSIPRSDTRLAYGASLGVAVVGVALVSGLVQHRRAGIRLRAVAGPVALAGVLVLGWASAGVGVHYVKTSQAEAQTIRVLDGWMASSPSPLRQLTIVVVAAGSAIPRGANELTYFSEEDGIWLDRALKRRCPECDTFVTKQVECVGMRNTIAVLEDQAERAVQVTQGKVTLADSTAFFRWTGQELVPDNGACRQA